jgi:putative restriction endonuclease
MIKYWWVNHKQTFDQEITGGYIWAPKVKKNGSPNHFYDNLRRAAPGDVIVSYAHTVVKYIGRVADFAISSPKPDSFGNAGEAWLDDGWMLPVIWRKLDTPFKPSLYTESLPELLREKYAPVQLTGRGNQGAYLSEVDQRLVNFILEKVATPVEVGTIFGGLGYEITDVGNDIDDIIEQQLLISELLSATDKVQVIKARRGQGIFRANVQKNEHACRVTGIETGFLLIASHIKPWRSCINSTERLDGNNGLLLTPHIDRLFDKGYVTFSDLGSLIISSKLDNASIFRLGLHEAKLVAVPFASEKRRYLDYHHRNVFLGQ